MLKKYQPKRTDLLINTDWGIPVQELTAEDARTRNLLSFQNRWVCREQKKQLKDEHHAYRSIRILGFILLLLAVFMFVNIRSFLQDGILIAAIAVIYALMAAASGIGLLKYLRLARYSAILICISFFILTFTPLFADDKGAPLLMLPGGLGLYYLLRKTARKIFSLS